MNVWIDEYPTDEIEKLRAIGIDIDELISAIGGTIVATFSEIMADLTDFISLLKKRVIDTKKKPCFNHNISSNPILVRCGATVRTRGPPIMLTVKYSGSFDNTDRFLSGAKRLNAVHVLEEYAKYGVQVLNRATPKDSGLTASSWGYKVQVNKRGYYIQWTNSNVVDGIPVPILIQYGHGTRGGSFISGRDFINPAMRPVFDALADKLWEEVKKL